MWLSISLCSLSDKGPNEDLRPEERPVEGEALTTSHISPLLPSLPLISPLSVSSTLFASRNPMGCLR